MRHRSAGIKLNRTSSHRKAMFRNMVTSLFKHERIRTTDAKAKEVRRWADKLVTLAKRGDLHARRQAMAIVREKDVVHKLFTEAPERFGQVNGGYTRVVKVGFRSGDAAPISMVELVTPEVKKKKARRKKKSERAAAPARGAAEAMPTQAAAATTEESSPADDVDARAESAVSEAPGASRKVSTTAEDAAPVASEAQTAESAPVDAAAEATSAVDAPAASEDDAAPEKTPPKES